MIHTLLCLDTWSPGSKRLKARRRELERRTSNTQIFFKPRPRWRIRARTGPPPSDSLWSIIIPPAVYTQAFDLWPLIHNDTQPRYSSAVGAENNEWCCLAHKCYHDFPIFPPQNKTCMFYGWWLFEDAALKSFGCLTWLEFMRWGPRLQRGSPAVT